MGCGVSMVDLMDGNSLCTQELGRWYDSNVRGLQKEIRAKHDELRVASSNIFPGAWVGISQVERDHDALREREELYWHQRSRDMWLSNGDKNIKYFHWRASARRARNHIRGLFDNSSHKVTAACLGFLNDGHGLEEVNGTLITLIPKVRRAERIMDYRSISLCNVLYKIVAKALANRLRGALGAVISETQSVFIPGRIISDNAIVGFECMHALKRPKKREKRLDSCSVLSNEMVPEQEGLQDLRDKKQNAEEVVGLFVGPSSEFVHMDVDVGSGSRDQTKIEATENVVGSCSCIDLGSIIGLKTGKWKRWARDGARIHNGLEVESQ
ncbi:hypothetical protein Dsin_018496 [Dipteronia sinensis]|uniref:Reverse transcriptase n=1 Tax=Dipteronia sinensis TaxID=43782 RepID=A0AAE0A5E4_9ROSI|nr:hypothetical protein Dsin_018496 [Dipteronia sinensis]